MIDATKLPVEPSKPGQASGDAADMAPVEYARAPESAGPQRTGTRPPAVQGNAR